MNIAFYASPDRFEVVLSFQHKSWTLSTVTNPHIVRVCPCFCVNTRMQVICVYWCLLISHVKQRNRFLEVGRMRSLNTCYQSSALGQNVCLRVLLNFSSLRLHHQPQNYTPQHQVVVRINPLLHKVDISLLHKLQTITRVGVHVHLQKNVILVKIYLLYCCTMLDKFIWFNILPRYWPGFLFENVGSGI